MLICLLGSEERVGELGPILGRELVLFPEYLEQVEHSKPGCLAVVRVLAHQINEILERPLVALGSCQRRRQLQSEVGVVWPAIERRLQFADVACRGSQPCRGQHAFDLVGGRHGLQQLDRLVGSVGRQEQGRQSDRSFHVLGIFLQNIAVDPLSTRLVSREEVVTGLGHCLVELVRYEIGEPSLQLVLGDGSGEAAHRLAVPESDHGRNTLHFELGSESLVLVDVDLGQLEVTISLGGCPLQHGPQGPTRCAPLGPEVHDDRNVVASLDHALLELGCGDVVDVTQEMARLTRPSNTGLASIVPCPRLGAMSRQTTLDPQFGRLMTAMITPFSDDGEVDHERAARLARHLVEGGSDSLLVTGTTGESPTLSSDEKVMLYRTVVDSVGSKASVIAGTGTYDTKASIALGRRAIEAGVHALLAVTPYYSRPPQAGLIAHFEAIADDSELPVILYNIPGRTGRLIEVDSLTRLAEHPRIVGVKDAVDDVGFTMSCRSRLPDDFAIYSGSDMFTFPQMAVGAVGVISVVAHLAGRQMRRLVDAASSGDLAEAERLHFGMLPLFEACFLEPNPMPVKAGLASLWEPVGVPRLPLIEASMETVQAIKQAVGDAQRL